MRRGETVRSVAMSLQVWETFVNGVVSRVGEARAQQIVLALAELPVKPSHATGLLGSYAHCGAKPQCIRLQPQQERTLLGSTLLHELAHACEHLQAPRPHRHRCGHGKAWSEWAQAFGISPRRSAHSTALAQLRHERLKPVAVCAKCGCVFHRLRRLPRRRLFVHPDCGNGRIVPVDP